MGTSISTSTPKKNDFMRKTGTYPVANTKKKEMQKVKGSTADSKTLIFMEDRMVTRAEWNQDNMYSYVRRFCGAMPESDVQFTDT
jgi:hypothetical protein